jgi:2-polyprenyl-6-methoxyphenol hydroxylase-like FAD-dependent oxidoreductase
MPSVLISGASIAGPTLAYWLSRFGFDVTVVERAPAPRAGGQAIDIRGAALEIIRDMELMEAARDKRTRMKGMSALDADGKEIWRTEERTYSGGRLDNDDIEILRDDLAALLLGSNPAAVDYLYGDVITGIEDADASATVSFSRNGTRRFDIVVGADGLHSRVRDLVFGDEKQFIHSLGVGLAVFSAPNFLGLEDWQVAYREAEAGYVVYTARENREVRVGLGFGADPEDDERRDIEAQKALVAERCGHLRWEIPRLIDAMWTAPDFYFGSVAQVRMERWSKGRVALVGDAGYCPSPFSGQGTSLALVGAYVLARELQRTPASHEDAFARYDARMRPYVLLNQALADPERQGPVPDEVLDKAKNAIVLDDLPGFASADGKRLPARAARQPS